MPPPSRRQMGILAATALVVGNMVGSGIFLLPSTLAPHGGLSLLGWLLSLSGILALALVFADFSRRITRQGGPYAYTREVFGPFVGFLVGWGYWVSIWCGNAAIAIALLGYLSVFLPSLQSPAAAAAVAAALVWLLTLVNLRGIRVAARVQVITTVLKLLPLLLVGMVGIFAIDPARLSLSAGEIQPPLRSILSCSALTLWAFLGVESATIPSGSVKEPHRTVARATIAGVLITAVVYVLSSTAVLGLVPAQELARAPAPFALAASRLLGGWASSIVAIGAIVACFGALNGWILLQGQMPRALAEDGLLPGWLGLPDPRGVPVGGMILGSGVTTLLLLASWTRGLVGVFEFAILLSTLAVLLPYLLCAVGRLMARRAGLGRLTTAGAAVALYASAFSLWAIVGTGLESVLWGLALLGSGVPVYLVWTGGLRKGARPGRAGPPPPA